MMAALLLATTALEAGQGQEEGQEGSLLTSGAPLVLPCVMKAGLLGLGLQVPPSPCSLGEAESPSLQRR